jgi:hypothetical protein
MPTETKGAAAFAYVMEDLNYYVAAVQQSLAATCLLYA